MLPQIDENTCQTVRSYSIRFPRGGRCWISDERRLPSEFIQQSDILLSTTTEVLLRIMVP